MHKTLFQNKFCKPTHKNPTIFSISNLCIRSFEVSKLEYRFSVRGPILWRNILRNFEKKQENVNLVNI